ncbi:GNAT family N-acetyltransferase [Aquamicrobium sp. LC103]|uniref:GNAT family N-acetyltransferase n=1 Tax=Aquamicrobium sp. LC103 TaxID=1120658 RepID=UPI00063EC9DA|nr:GNAT family N-acetyltransferase [Aquamicrobium sp. LC103]TKT74942.1 GNAT family N-acetyltransferase [Aquamicrobium sp. LC103]
MLTQNPIAIERLPPDFAHWAELLDLIRRSFAYMDGVIDPPSSVHRLTEQGLREKARTEIGLLARDGDRLCGCVFLRAKDDHLYVGKLAVDPALSGAGIGRHLMAKTEAVARSLGKPVLELQTRIELAANHAIFARLGFVETQRTAHEGYSRPTTITMRKALT